MFNKKYLNISKWSIDISHPLISGTKFYYLVFFACFFLVCLFPKLVAAVCLELLHDLMLKLVIKPARLS